MEGGEEEDRQIHLGCGHQPEKGRQSHMGAGPGMSMPRPVPIPLNSGVGPAQAPKQFQWTARAVNTALKLADGP